MALLCNVLLFFATVLFWDNDFADLNGQQPQLQLQNTNRKSYFASQMQLSACFSKDRMFPKLPLAST